MFKATARRTAILDGHRCNGCGLPGFQDDPLYQYENRFRWVGYRHAHCETNDR